jgi:hypothetical protein
LLSVLGLTQNTKAVIKLSPLSAIDEVSFPTIQGGIEIPLSKRMSWYNDIGIRFRKGTYEKTDTSFVSAKGLKVKTEFRYYFGRFLKGSPQNRMNGYYLALNLFYINDQHNTAIGYYYQRDTGQTRNDNFDVTKSVWGGTLVIGRQYPVYKHLLVDYYTGLGVRCRNVANNNLEYHAERDKLIAPIDINIPHIREVNDATAGQTVLVHFSLGIRFCYRF